MSLPNGTVEPKAPHWLVMAVAIKTGRSTSTIKAVIYGNVVSAVISKAIEEARQEAAEKHCA